MFGNLLFNKKQKSRSVFEGRAVREAIKRQNFNWCERFAMKYKQTCHDRRALQHCWAVLIKLRTEGARFLKSIEYFQKRHDFTQKL
jgi:hypothetical protein